MAPASMQPLTRVGDVSMMAKSGGTKPTVSNKAKPLSPGSNCTHAPEHESSTHAPMLCCHRGSHRGRCSTLVRNSGSD